MHWLKQRERFRTHLEGNQCTHPGSVFDPISARIAEHIGFEVGMFAGSVASLTILGDPDHIVLSLTEFAQQAYRICRASELPILVDADHGYGNALNVRRTVEELETAGVSALSIEDTKLPRSFGAGNKTSLISIAEGVGKMRAAVSARQDPGLVIAARTSAVSATDLEDAISRITASQETGVDAIFLVGVSKKQEIEAIARICNLPLILGGASPDITDLEYLGSLGVRICLQSHQPVMAAIMATYDTLMALREGVQPADIETMLDTDLLDKLSRVDDYDRWIQDFLE